MSTYTGIRYILIPFDTLVATDSMTVFSGSIWRTNGIKKGSFWWDRYGAGRKYTETSITRSQLSWFRFRIFISVEKKKSYLRELCLIRIKNNRNKDDKLLKSKNSCFDLRYFIFNKYTCKCICCRKWTFI